MRFPEHELPFMLDVDMLDVDMLRVVESWHCLKVNGSALYLHNIIEIQLNKGQHTCLVGYFNFLRVEDS